MQSKNVICILGKPVWPEKEELELRLGSKKAEHLRRAFLLDSLASALRVGHSRIVLAFWPEEIKTEFEDAISLFTDEEKSRELVRKAGKITLLPLSQAFNTPGKLLDELSRVLFESGAKKLLLTCPQSPHTDPMILKASFKLLKNNDMVLGPTFSGAYYLFGLCKHRAGFFEEIDWQAGSIYKEIVGKLEKLNLKWQELEISYDVNRLEELEQLYCDIENLRLTGKDNICCHTEKYLTNLK